MLIYVCSRYSRFPEMQIYAKELQALGHTVTSRWIRGDHELRAHGEAEREDWQERWAREDWHDLEHADTVIAFTEGPAKALAARGVVEWWNSVWRSPWGSAVSPLAREKMSSSGCPRSNAIPPGRPAWRRCASRSDARRTIMIEERSTDLTRREVLASTAALATTPLVPLVGPAEAITSPPEGTAARSASATGLSGIGTIPRRRMPRPRRASSPPSSPIPATCRAYALLAATERQAWTLGSTADRAAAHARALQYAEQAVILAREED